MDSKQLAKRIRLKTLSLVHRANASHIGGALSMADILAVLYAEILNVNPENPKEPERDRLLLSKGHCCVALYSVLAYKGFFPVEELDSYGSDGNYFLSHSTHYVSGVEISSGSLGHGLPVACGLALSAKRQEKKYKTYCIVGDGEMNEGSNWEALLFAAQHELDNLYLIIDYNKIQGLGNTNDILNLEPLRSKLEAFNWNVIQIDGHNHIEILNAFRQSEKTNGKPTVIIADTIKGKGVSFMENNLLWHYKSPTEEQYNRAVEEIKNENSIY